MADELHTPEEWIALLNPDLKIVDPDGWRGPDAPPFDQPISQDEFSFRFALCTIRSDRPL